MTPESRPLRPRSPRDLEDIGAVKVRAAGGESVYAVPDLPKDRVAPEEHLRRVLGEWVVDVASSANVVVVRTPPGSAHVVASALDRAALEDWSGPSPGMTPSWWWRRSESEAPNWRSAWLPWPVWMPDRSPTQNARDEREGKP